MTPTSTQAIRNLRNRIGAIFFAVPFATFSTFMWLFFSYFSSHPTEPHRELGLIHPLSKHGSHVYISDSEATGMSLLIIGFFVGAILAISIIPKEFALPSKQTPRWMTYVSASFKIDAASPDKIVLFVVSGLASFFIIWFAGREIVDFITSHGVVLNFGF